MRWYHYLAYFFGGAFLVNAIPHIVMGISGQPFQSPFATPPGLATVNLVIFQAQEERISSDLATTGARIA